MTDYGKLLELKTVYNVQLIAVSQPTQNTPAGRMARTMMATMGTFFAEQLSVDVKDGLAQPEPVAAWFRKVLLGSATQQLAQVRARCSNLHESA